jgi:hypothetical protein
MTLEIVKRMFRGQVHSKYVKCLHWNGTTGHRGEVKCIRWLMLVHHSPHIIDIGSQTPLFVIAAVVANQLVKGGKRCYLPRFGAAGSVTTMKLNIAGGTALYDSPQKGSMALSGLAPAPHACCACWDRIHGDEQKYECRKVFWPLVQPDRYACHNANPASRDMRWAQRVVGRAILI